MSGFYEHDFGLIEILDDSPVPFPMPVVSKPSYTTDRKAYLKWKKEQGKLSIYEDAFNTMLEFLWVNGRYRKMVWRDGWLHPVEEGCK
jgi:hypothetical protein